MQSQGIMCARKRVARLMRQQELFAQRPRHRTVTTKSEPGAQVAPNLLERDFSADQPNTKWVADTTYLWTAEGWLYLAVVLDLFSRLVVGWSMAAIQDATLVTQALRMAVTRRRPQAGLLHHSDRGSTYTSEDYQSLLRQEGMQISMSRTADCYENAALIRFASLVSKVNALMASLFRHEHKPEARLLITSNVSIIGPGDIQRYNM